MVFIVLRVVIVIIVNRKNSTNIRVEIWIVTETRIVIVEMIVGTRPVRVVTVVEIRMATTATRMGVGDGGDYYRSNGISFSFTSGSTDLGFRVLTSNEVR